MVTHLEPDILECEFKWLVELYLEPGTSHWAILLCQPLESCFLTFPCVFREASYIIFMLMGFRWVFFKTPPCSLQTYFFSGALRNCTAKPFKPCISMASIVTSFLFMILLTWDFSIFLLKSLAKIHSFSSSFQ